MDGRRARRVLGVRKNAGPDEIRRAFRARALVAHPDHGGDAVAFAEVRSAFEVLRAAAPVTRAALGTAAQPRVRVDVYDSPRRPTPRRDFADVLRSASARLI
jgi:curved DNA-binding protein CbpA